MADEETSNPNNGANQLDEFITILRNHNHPLVITEIAALRYMGVRQPFTDMDFLIRDSQIESITAAVDALESFERAEPNYSTRLGGKELDLVPRFFNKTPGAAFSPQYVNLWSESVYKLKMDDAELRPVDSITVINTFILDERFTQIPELENESDAVYRSQGFNTASPRPFTTLSGVQVLLPSFSDICNALLHQAEDQLEKYGKRDNHRPIYNLQNLIRYVKLEYPEQRAIILPLLGPRRQAMEDLMNKYKRKPVSIVKKGPDGEVTVETYIGRRRIACAPVRTGT